MGFNDGTFEIIGCAMQVHRALGPGLREKPYENALIIALRRKGIQAEGQKPYPIRLLGEVVGDCIPDITVGRTILVDVKSIDEIGENEEAQMLNYLRISKLEVGMIINFKNPKLTWVRKVKSQQSEEF